CTTGEDPTNKEAEGDQIEGVPESPSEGDGTHKKKNKKKNRRKLKPEDRPLSTGLEGFYDGYNIPVYHINPKDNPTPVPQFDQWGRPDRNVELYFTQCSLKR
ncbi:hypothetical protein, partial [Salmonella sp. s51228]|uniref:hypothetical protein n=1 Tax=Salmonella sp. s51228 TaxID=3159652 RepID=UPI00397FEE98